MHKHLDEAGRAARLESLLGRYSPRPGFETEQFVTTRGMLQTERGLTQ